MTFLTGPSDFARHAVSISSRLLPAMAQAMQHERRSAPIDPPSGGARIPGRRRREKGAMRQVAARLDCAVLRMDECARPLLKPEKEKKKFATILTWLLLEMR